MSHSSVYMLQKRQSVVAILMYEARRMLQGSREGQKLHSITASGVQCSSCPSMNTVGMYSRIQDLGASEEDV